MSSRFCFISFIICVLWQPVSSVVDGRNAPLRRARSTVQLVTRYDDDGGFCTGSVIGPESILTATHCKGVDHALIGSFEPLEDVLEKIEKKLYREESNGLVIKMNTGQPMGVLLPVEHFFGHRGFETQNFNDNVNDILGFKSA